MEQLILLSIILILCFSGYAQHEQHINPENTEQDSSHAYILGTGRYIPPTGNKVTYNLTVSDTTVNYTGKKMRALATNGQIPFYFKSPGNNRLRHRNPRGPAV